MRLEGVWRLGDIGLAHRGESSAGNRGTQAYWPPEGPRDNSADLYSLGKTILLYSAGGSLSQSTDDLGKSLVFTGNDRRAGMFKKVLARACESDPAQRYKTAEEMLHDLDRIGSRGVRRRPILVAIALFLLVAPTLMVWSIFHQKPRPDAFWKDTLEGEDVNRLAELGKQLGDFPKEGRWSEAAASAESLLALLNRHLPEDRPEIRSTNDALRLFKRIASLTRDDQEEMNQVELLVPKIFEHTKKGELEEALRKEKRVYEIRHRLLGDDYAVVALGLLNEGYLEGQLKNSDSADKKTDVALELLAEKLGDQHPEVALAYNNIGASFRDANKFSQAKDYLDKGLQIRSKQLGNHMFTGMSHLSLAKYYAKRLEVKEPTNELVPDWRKLGREHVEVARKIAQSYEQRIAQLDKRLKAAPITEYTGIKSILEQRRNELKDLNETIQEIVPQIEPLLGEL